MTGRAKSLGRMARCLCVALAALGSLNPAGAGDLATLHRRLVEQGGTVTVPAAPKGQGADGDGLPRGVMPLTPLAAGRPVPDIARVGLERTPCFGTCAAYTVIFEADGSFVYTGDSNVERLGEHRGTVSQGRLFQVFRYVEAIEYLKLADTYDPGLLDVPSVYTLVEWGGATKVVLDVGNYAPATVWALAELLDDLLEGATWH